MKPPSICTQYNHILEHPIRNIFLKEEYKMAHRTSSSLISLFKSKFLTKAHTLTMESINYVVFVEWGKDQQKF